MPNSKTPKPLTLDDIEFLAKLGARCNIEQLSYEGLVIKFAPKEPEVKNDKKEPDVFEQLNQFKKMDRLNGVG